jgi:hypothetical protein
MYREICVRIVRRIVRNARMGIHVTSAWDRLSLISRHRLVTYELLRALTGHICKEISAKSAH